ncbi:ornithine cyclodeaminase [Scopulibacillus darangshiensis]|uniref:Ornithine cyclodeaminase n=1 Tax=Scopulibacillus darangshiensis TaxID=442528 RepID=A0A4R2P1W3_9BACL|nr:ornithine cyclodeaminase family protein [Scopulibacillus darangshiensis]TCP28699.1 ornithine cyclodeaminase [Scopulibacillus darangshiensis]
MLVLNEKAIDEAATMKDIINAIEDAYRIYEKGAFNMPKRSHISEGDNTLLLMPCLNQNGFGTKIVSVFPNNKKHPVIQGLMLLNDGETGKPKALLNGRQLTAVRTGAVGGAAVRYLSPESATSAGLIGTGVQGMYQLIATCSERTIKDIYLSNRSQEKIPAFAKKLRSHISADTTIHITGSAEEAVRHSDIIITATTSKTPVLPDDPDIYNGKLAIGIGSFQPNMREFPQSLLTEAENMFIDSNDATHETGDLIDPLTNGWLRDSQILPFSKLVSSEVEVDLSHAVPRVFKSTGMALFDLVVAETIYKKARTEQIGQFIEL